MQNLFKFSIVLCLDDNTHKSQADKVADIESQIRKLTGGVSSCYIAGSWLDECTGRVYQDDSKLVWTSTTDEKVQQLLACVPTWADWLGQESIYCEVIPVQVYFIEPTYKIAEHVAVTEEHGPQPEEWTVDNDPLGIGCRAEQNIQEYQTKTDNTGTMWKV
jgi:hypothetical protein